MNLLKELQAVKQKHHNLVDGDTVLKEASQLLLAAHDADTKTLEALQLNQISSYEKVLKQDIIRTKKAEDIYAQESFTGRQIKELCQKYNLKCLSTNYYSGSIPSTLASTVRSFCEKHGFSEGSGRFYILAPVEMFQTTKYIHPKQDPILFYKTSDSDYSSYNRGGVDESDLLIQVDNWGNDFTFSRKFSHLLSTYEPRNEWSNKLCTEIASTVLLITLFLGIVFNTFFLPVVGLIVFFLFISHTSTKYINETWNNDRV